MVTKKAKPNQQRFNVFEGARRVSLVWQFVIAAIIAWNIMMDFSIPTPSTELWQDTIFNGELNEPDFDNYQDIDGYLNALVKFNLQNEPNSNEKSLPEPSIDDYEYLDGYMKAITKYVIQQNQYSEDKDIKESYIYKPDIDDYEQLSEYAKTKVKFEIQQNSYIKKWLISLFSTLCSALFSAALSVIVIRLITSLNGWIIRGFLNIPRGQDFRDKA